jgi:carboxyl-terminal processing protease
MMRQVDPYAAIIGPDELEPFRREAVPVGIGVELEGDPATGLARVVTPVKDSPAYQAGIRAGDLITQITFWDTPKGKPLDLPDNYHTRGQPIEEVRKRIPGKYGTSVHLTVLPEGGKHPLLYEVQRGRVRLETVLGHRRNADDSWDYLIDQEKKVGYIRITSFGRGTTEDFVGAFRRLEAQGMKGLILDLRFSPGSGLFVQGAVDVAERFLDKGVIATVHVAAGEERFSVEKLVDRTDVPLVCLVNEESAGSSEVLAACLQDHKRAVVIGERTRGKGAVRNTQPFHNGQLMFTAGVVLRPSGKKLDRMRLPGHDDEEWGVTPDKGYHLKLSSSERDGLRQHLKSLECLPPPAPTRDFIDRQLECALAHLRASIKNK